MTVQQAKQGVAMLSIAGIGPNLWETPLPNGRRVAIRALPEPLDPEGDGYLWHYSPAVDQIVNSQCFWARRYEDLADKNELLYGLNLLVDAWNRRKTALGKDNSDLAAWMDECLHKLRHDRLQFPTYVLCASQSDRVDFLWKHYARTGGAAGFSREHAHTLAVLDESGSTASASLNYIGWSSVCYKPRRQVKLANAVVDFMIELQPRPGEEDIPMQRRNTILYQGAAHFFAFVKEEKYASEREVRYLVAHLKPEAPAAEFAILAGDAGSRYVRLGFFGKIVIMAKPETMHELYDPRPEKVLTKLKGWPESVAVLRIQPARPGGNSTRNRARSKKRRS